MAALADKHAYAIELEQKVRLQREYAKDLEHAVSTGGQEVISCASPASFFFVMLMLPLLLSASGSATVRRGSIRNERRSANVPVSAVLLLRVQLRTLTGPFAPEGATLF